MRAYYNALRGAYYYPFVVRVKSPMREGKTARKRARRERAKRGEAGQR